MKSSRYYLIQIVVLSACLFLSACNKPELEPQPQDKEVSLSAEDIALNNRGVALMGYFDYTAAREVFAQNVNKHPDWHQAKVNLAIATLNQQLDGDEEQALTLLKEVLSKDPTNLRAHYVTALLQARAGESEQATQLYEYVLEHDPNDAYVAYNLAVLVQTQDPQRALGLFQRAIDLDPYLRSAYYGRFLLLVRSGDREAGLKMQQAYERLADNPRAKLVETKYTRMGTKANALAVGIDTEPPFTLPDGELFGAPHALLTFQDKQSRSLTTVDLQNNGRQDIVVAGSAGTHAIVMAKEDEYRAASSHPLLKVGNSNAMAWGDIDNDGYTDMLMCGKNQFRLWRQLKNNQWERSVNLLKLAGRRTCQSLMLLDADHDGDLDVLGLFNQSGHDIFSNNGNKSFRSLASEKQLDLGQSAGLGAAVADLDNDRDTDLLVINGGSNKNVVLLNDRLWDYQPATGFDDIVNSPLLAITTADIDADGVVEIYAVHADGVLKRWQKTDREWQAQELLSVNMNSAPELSIADFNGDGRLDILLVDGAGVSVLSIEQEKAISIFQYQGVVLSAIPVVSDADRGPSLFALVKTGAGEKLMHWPPGKARGQFLSLSFSGKENKADSMRSNRSGIGTQVSVRRGSHWTVLDTFDHHSGPGQSLQPLAIGMGAASKVDYIEIDWSDGVFQTELDLAVGKTQLVTETQRQLSSCPVLFAWNGAKWEFVSDILGVGGLGFFHAPGEYAQPRPWEYFQFPAGLLAPKDGFIRIKITEPMEELAMLDQVQLHAYDLAPGWNMVMDDRMATNKPAVTGEAIFYKEEWLPQAVQRDDGLDVTAAVRAIDKKAAPLGAVHPRYLGRLMSSRALTLKFTRPLDSMPAMPVLIADGWVEYPYSQTVFAAWQAQQTYLPPSLEAAGADGKWRVVYDQFGYPAGMPRRMALPLKNLPPGTTQLRIRSNLQIYWDRFSVAFALTPGDNVRRHTLPLSSASLVQSGFPKRSNGAQQRPHYDYNKRLPFWDSRYPKGHYSTLGNVLPLMLDEDGGFAIIGPGEEVDMAFAEQAPTAQNWSRHYVLYTAGFAKDMDMYTQHSGTVGPFPDAVKIEQQLHKQYNVRFRDGF